MKTGKKLVLIGIILLISVVLVVSACGEKKDGDTVEPVTSATDTEVSIEYMSFNPHTIVVATGTTVTWVNNDDTTHALTSKEGWFSSDNLSPEKKFSHQFSEPGTYNYSCGIHSSMEGVIIVQPGGGVAPVMFKDTDVAGAYQDSCSGCHGPSREGATGVALVPQRLKQSDEYYFDIVKNGKPGTVMPEHSTLYTDEEVWSLVGFMRSEVSAEALEWGMDKIAETHRVKIKPKWMVDEPEHTADLDNLMLVTERETSGIAVFDGDTHEKLGTVKASYRAHGYAMHPTDNRWAYNVGRDGWLMKIDLYTLKVAIKVRVGLDSRGIAVSDDGKYIIVGNYIPNTAVIVDADTLEPIKVIETEGENPQGEFVKSRVCITSDVSPELVGSYFIIALKEAGQLWRIDWSDPEFPIDKLKDVGNILHDGFLRPDNKRFYIASQTDDWMAVADVENWTLVKKIMSGDTPHPGSGATWTWENNDDGFAATVHAGEGKITVWSTESNDIVAEIETSGPGLFVRATEENPYVWADTVFGDPPNQTYVFDKNTFEVIHIIEEGVKTLHPELTADGKFVYISDWHGNKVRVYDAYTFEKVAEVEVDSPTGIFSVSRRHETLGH